MEKQFIYKEKFSFYHFIPALAAIVIAGLCWYYGYGIAIGNLRILAYPNSVYVMGGLGVIFLISSVCKMKKISDSKKNPTPIVVKESGLVFPKGKDTVSVAFKDITHTFHKDDEDDGRAYVIRANDKTYSFYEDRFESGVQYIEFVDALNANLGENVISRSLADEK